MTTLERFKDWRTTLPTLLAFAAVLYALKVRPEWGTAELIGFGGSLLALATGLLAVAAPKPAAPDAAPKAPPLPLLWSLLVGVVVGALVVVPVLAIAGCTAAQQAAAAKLGGAALEAVDGPACDLVEVRSGSALAGVLCEAAAAVLEQRLAGSTAQALTSSDAVPRARTVAPRCKLVPVRSAGRHHGFACAEHEAVLVAAFARDGGT